MAQITEPRHTENIIEGYESEKIGIWPTAAAFKQGSGSAPYSVPLRAFRVYKGSELIYPKEEELALPYRLRLKLVHSKASAGMASTNSQAIAPRLAASRVEVEVTIETARPCFVARVTPDMAEEGQAWDTENIGPNGIYIIRGPGACITDALAVTLPVVARCSWQYTERRIQYGGRKDMGDIMRAPTEADAAFITWRQKATVNGVNYDQTYIFYHVPSLRKRSVITSPGYAASFGSIDVTEKASVADERVMARAQAFPLNYANSDDFPYWSMVDTGGVVWRPLVYHFSGRYKNALMKTGRVALNTFQTALPVNATERMMCMGSYFSVISPTAWKVPDEFYAFFNGHFCEYREPDLNWLMMHERSYEIVSNNNPTFATARAWLEAIDAPIPETETETGGTTGT